MVVAALSALLSGRGANVMTTIISPLVALAALAVTAALLIFDLKRPDRFYFLITKPNFRSWLVIGAYILMAYGALCSVWLFYGYRTGEIPDFVIFPTAIFAAASACYSAFLFAQAKGRDLWQSPLFFWHLLIQAMVAGSAIWFLGSMYLHSERALPSLVLLFVFLGLSLGMVLVETALPHASEDVRLAVRHMVRGPLRIRWGIAIGAGMVLPFLLAAFAWSSLGAMVAAALLALAGVWWYEDVRVKAGQSLPLS
jgi:formate-dependent nitrite reductase membrane component NrfD